MKQRYRLKANTSQGGLGAVLVIEVQYNRIDTRAVMVHEYNQAHVISQDRAIHFFGVHGPWTRFMWLCFSTALRMYVEVPLLPKYAVRNSSNHTNSYKIDTRGKYLYFFKCTSGTLLWQRGLLANRLHEFDLGTAVRHEISSIFSSLVLEYPMKVYIIHVFFYLSKFSKWVKSPLEEFVEQPKRNLNTEFAPQRTRLWSSIA